MPVSQIIGGGTSTVAEVETTKALRGILRPTDWTSFGNYRVSGVSGTMAAGIGTLAVLFAFRWANNNVCLLRRVEFTAATQTAFTAGGGYVYMNIARSFRQSYTGGNSLLPTGNMNKLRTSMATTLMTDIRQSSTAALTAPANLPLMDTPMAKLPLLAPATAGKTMTGQGFYAGEDDIGHVLFEARPGEFPIRFQQDEGFIIRTGSANPFPAVGTWVFAVTVHWDERATWY